MKLQEAVLICAVVACASCDQAESSATSVGPSTVETPGGADIRSLVVGVWASDADDCDGGGTSILFRQDGTVVTEGMAGVWTISQNELTTHWTSETDDDWNEVSISKKSTAELRSVPPHKMIGGSGFVMTKCGHIDSGGEKISVTIPSQSLLSSIKFESIPEGDQYNISKSTKDCHGDLTPQANFIIFDLNGDGYPDYYTENGVNDYNCRGNAHYSSVWISEGDSNFHAFHLLVSAEVSQGKRGGVIIGRPISRSCDDPGQVTLIGWDENKQSLKDITPCLSIKAAQKETIDRGLA